jgi:biotin synthase-related radical SAM superfamily protein
MSIFDEMNQIKSNFEAVIEKLHDHSEEKMAVNIIIDDADPQSPIFVEIENDNGESISIGEDARTNEGYRKIRITTHSIISNEKI